VSEPASEGPEPEELQRTLSAIEAKRKKLTDAGLLGSNVDPWNVATPPIDSIDSTKRAVLAVYGRDSEEKLKVFDDLLARVEAIVRIASARLRNKRVSVGEEGLRVSNRHGSNLDVEMLSSGEQHELVLLYELLFRATPGSLFLIDEPELSLHVTWQQAFLDDLKEMATLSQFEAILATHSPQIVGGRWDLAIQLGDRDDA
jgi:hypothetical protein